MREMSPEDIPLIAGEVSAPSLADSCNHEMFLKCTTGLYLYIERSINAKLFLANFYVSRAKLTGIYLDLYDRTEQRTFIERAVQIRNTTPISMSSWAQRAVGDSKTEANILGTEVKRMKEEADIAQFAANIFIIKIEADRNKR